MSLPEQINEIRSERTAGKNTAERIGACLMALFEAVTARVTPQTLTSALATKVDKVQGKGLSTLDYNNAERQKADRALKKVSFRADADKVIVSTENNLSQGSEQILPAATPQSAGFMTAEDKEKIEHIRDVESIAIAAIKKIYTEQFNDTLGLFIERSEDDYTLPLPLATTSTAGVMSASDKSRLNALMKYGVRSLRLGTNPSNGVVYLEYAGPEGPIDIVLPTVTPTTNGLMSAADKERLDNSASFDSIGQLSSKVGSLTSALATKVDKVPGKGLSTLDYNNDERQKADRALKKVSFRADADKVIVSTENNLSQGSEQILPAATTQSAGIMTAADKRRIDSFGFSLQNLMQTLNQLAERVSALEK